MMRMWILVLASCALITTASGQKCDAAAGGGSSTGGGGGGSGGGGGGTTIPRPPEPPVEGGGGETGGPGNPFLDFLQGIFNFFNPFGEVSRPMTVVLDKPPNETVAQERYVEINKLEDKTEVIDDGKIVGGMTATGDYPFFASLLIHVRENLYSICGGSIISPNFIVTAAHCIYKENSTEMVKAEDISVKTGSKRFNQGTLTSISRIIVSKDEPYNHQTKQNDIALLESVETLTGTPISLPKSGQDFVGKCASVIGFGATIPGSSSTPSRLQYINIPVLKDSDCKNYRGFDNKVMICAGDKRGGKDSCQGDSGGPLFLEGGNNTLIGIVSFGRSCADPNYPGVYTKVTHFLPFIRQYTGV